MYRNNPVFPSCNFKIEDDFFFLFSLDDSFHFLKPSTLRNCTYLRVLVYLPKENKRKLHVSESVAIPAFRRVFSPMFLKTASREPMREETCDCDIWSPDNFLKKVCLFEYFDKIRTFPSLTYTLIIY